jgi:hypothetical protein
MTVLTILRAVATLLLALAAASAAAQYPGGSGGKDGRGGMRGPGAGTMREPMRGSAASQSPMIQVQLDQFEDELKLTKEQQPEWNRYAERVAKLMDEVARMRQPGAAASGSAVEQLDALAATARSRVVAIEGIVDAGRRLYPSLTPEQKGIADRRLARIVGPALGLPAAPPGAGPGPRP